MFVLALPRNTLTAFEPVTLPTEASAQSSSIAATLEAKVSKGRMSLEDIQYVHK